MLKLLLEPSMKISQSSFGSLDRRKGSKKKDSNLKKDTEKY